MSARPIGWITTHPYPIMSSRDYVYDSTLYNNTCIALFVWYQSLIISSRQRSWQTKKHTNIYTNAPSGNHHLLIAVGIETECIIIQAWFQHSIFRRDQLFTWPMYPSCETHVWAHNVYLATLTFITIPHVLEYILWRTRSVTHHIFWTF